jgi:hypothetical protein
VQVDFCTVAREYVTKTQVALTQDLQDARANPEAFQGRVRDDFKAADKQNQDLAASAPSSVKSDMEYLATTFHGFVQALDTAGYDPMKVAPEAFQKLQDPAYYDASRRVNAYAEQFCGVATPTTESSTTTIFETPTTRRVTTTVRRLVTTTVPPTTVPPTTVPPTTLPPTTVPPSTVPPTTVPPTTAPTTTVPPTTSTTDPDDGDF